MIFDYFFLKFYNGILKSSLDFPRFGASLTFGLLVNLNIFETSMVLAKLDILPFIYPDNKPILYISTPVIAAILFLLYNKNRIEAIKLKFSKDELKPMKRKLNIAFILYIVLSIVSVFILAWWKPGYLPTW